MSAQRRLQDLLAGWSYFAETDKFAGAELEYITELYQAAGNIQTDEEVTAFVTNKMLPLIMKGKL